MKKRIERFVSKLIGWFKLNPSDGHHSYQELYASRNALFVRLLLDSPTWQYAIDLSPYDAYGPATGYWPVLAWPTVDGVERPDLQVSFHLPATACQFLQTHKPASRTYPGWDGRDTETYIRRLTRPSNGEEK